jgi:site-specific recombinase XerD
MKELNIHKVCFIVQQSTKRDKNRYVPVNDRAKELLKLHYQYSDFKNPEDYVISTKNGKTNTNKNMGDIVKAICKNAETKIQNPVTHILRHTCASLYFRAGVSVEVICKILGNSREVCEKTYIHFVEEQLKNAASQTIKAIDFF